MSALIPQRKWRQGRKLGRSLYEMVGTEPSDRDNFIGLMDSMELAREVVEAHNLLMEVE